MPGAIVHFRVASFEAFRRVYEQNAVLRRAFGISRALLCQAAGDANDVFLFLECDDLENLRVYEASDEIQQAMKVGGVITPPQVQYLETVHNHGQ